MDNNIISSTSHEVEIPQMKSLQNNFSAAFKLVDDVVLKNYITKLPDLPVVPLDDSRLTNSLGKIRLFKITEMVYEQDESATYKFASVFNAVAATNSAIVTVINSDGAKTDFYLGIRSLSDNNSTQTSYSALVNAMKGQFPGTKTENLKVDRLSSCSTPSRKIPFRRFRVLRITRTRTLLTTTNIFRAWKSSLLPCREANIQQS